ncbi:unnamed protein product [Lota lota]
MGDAWTDPLSRRSAWLARGVGSGTRNVIPRDARRGSRPDARIPLRFPQRSEGRRSQRHERDLWAIQVRDHSSRYASAFPTALRNGPSRRRPRREIALAIVSESVRLGTRRRGTKSLSDRPGTGVS